MDNDEIESLTEEETKSIFALLENMSIEDQQIVFSGTYSEYLAKFHFSEFDLDVENEKK
jgi:hypothetical protein